MLKIKGYILNELIYSGPLFKIYRGVRISDRQHVILKACLSGNITFKELTDQCFKLILKHTETVHDNVEIYKIQSHAFTQSHIQILKLLAAQAAISLENSSLYYQATHDPLTGLANRNLLYPFFSHAVHQAKRSHKSIAILFLDLDTFKAVNDTLGHHIGDNVLLYFSEQLKACLREGDLAVRLGGDEFIIMLENITDVSQVIAIAKRILDRLAKPAHILGHEIRLHASIGISLYPQHSSDIQELIRHADRALYSVKENNKGTFQFYKA